VIGTLSRRGELGEAYVSLPGDDGTPRPARSLVPLDDAHVGRSVALMFEAGDPARPILMGIVHDPMDELIAGRAALATTPTSRIEAQIDDESVVLEARKQIVLRCGKASITLSPDGKVCIRGTDLLSRSSGGQRIQGASVAIN
jgi:hypothetical protein